MWNIKKIISKGDYNYALVQNHPKATKNGYVLEHRVVMENHLNRLLMPNEVVHHVNGNRKDNRIENLEVVDFRIHARKHSLKKGRVMVVFKCVNCGKEFLRNGNQSPKSRGTIYAVCSRRCNGKFGRNVQLQGITTRMKKAISENIVSSYRVYRQLDNSEQTGEILDA